MKELDQLRTEINGIDTEMASLFEKRMKVCGQIAEYKKKNGLSVRDLTREAELIEKNRSLINDPTLEPYYVRFLKNTVEVSCEYQSYLMNGMKVAYSGTEGAYAYIAAKKMYPSATLTAFPDFRSAYNAVESGEYDCAVLPLENSYAGEVGDVMDMIFSGSLYINQVIDLDISHCLIGTEESDIKKVKTVISHPQALAQCDDYIRSHDYSTRSCSNTAIAAKQLKEVNDPSLAAIASPETAEIFGLKILDSGINSSRTNTTRFAAFSGSRNSLSYTKKREDENFILVFTVKNEAGALAQTLNIIGAHGFNMRTLRSRPMKELLWNYYFYVEAEGNIETEDGADMLRELSALCAKLRLAGTYYTSKN